MKKQITQFFIAVIAVMATGFVKGRNSKNN